MKTEHLTTAYRGEPLEVWEFEPVKCSLNPVKWEFENVKEWKPERIEWSFKNLGKPTNPKPR